MIQAGNVWMNSFPEQSHLALSRGKPSNCLPKGPIHPSKQSDEASLREPSDRFQNN